MKNFRKVAAVLLIVAFVCALALVFVACDNKHQPIDAEQIVFEIQDDTAKVTFVDKDKNTEVVYNDKFQAHYLSELIFYLSGKGVLEAEYTGSATYGMFLTKVGNVEQDSNASLYLYIYTDIDEYKETVPDYTFTATYNNKTYTSTNKGASSLELKNGTYLIGLMKW